jgi:hypothetical protein
MLEFGGLQTIYEAIVKMLTPKLANRITEAQGSEMKLKNHPGFKRLTVLITLASFIITYILLFVDGYYGEREIFFEFPIAAALIAIVTFIFVRIIYWVIDGFRKEE